MSTPEQSIQTIMKPIQKMLEMDVKAILSPATLSVTTLVLKWQLRFWDSEMSLKLLLSLLFCLERKE
jgi:hypothetical protein